ncbi:hypothetical protein B296_00015296 [Ensete ventricosum]|uniref:Glycoside hydrolase family 38 N-terminal domain-containing protein n=1 Tax=Ensete ventricosum TaxID=4639 RepID=A0A426ZEL2_ENSVE|nr:hypothetical protein B296_00015296 [Ensete ventricosum]
MARPPTASPFLCLSLVILALAGVTRGGYIAYDTSGGTVVGKLNVHLVPHSHDDVGWLKTIDQYYVGSNNSIQVLSSSFRRRILKILWGACVMNVLDSVVDALLKNPNRKFIFAEQVLDFSYLVL